MLFRVKALPAERGDCLWIEYGTSESEKYILIVDTGTEGTLAHLERRLKAVKDEGVEALVVTHIDDDHIGSAAALLRKPAMARKFKDVWFNGRKHCGNAIDKEAYGVRSAVAVEGVLLEKDLPWNRIVDDKAIRVNDDGSPRVLPRLAGDMQVTVLGPTLKELMRLGVAWDEGVLEIEQKESRKRVAEQPPPSGLEGLGPESLDIKSLASGAVFDSSVTNASSIVLLLEFAGKRILLAADARATTVRRSYGRIGKPTINLLKVSHHGSRNNTSRTLITDLLASRFLICTDGSVHNHPDDECIARLLESPGPKKIYCNYETESSAVWRDNTELALAHKYKVIEGDDGFVEIDMLDEPS